MHGNPRLGVHWRNSDGSEPLDRPLSRKKRKKMGTAPQLLSPAAVPAAGFGAAEALSLQRHSHSQIVHIAGFQILSTPLKPRLPAHLRPSVLLAFPWTESLQITQDAGHPSILQPHPQAVPARGPSRCGDLVGFCRDPGYPQLRRVRVWLTRPSSATQRCYSTGGERVAKYEGTKDSKVRLVDLLCIRN